MAEHEVWGFTIRTSPSGKRIWPNELKREVTRRLREDGASPGDVAAELGAHECLVRKWWVADRRNRGEQISVEGPAFAPVALAEPATPTSHAAAGERSASGYARLHLGSICFEFPVGIGEADLLKLIRVAGQSR